MNDGPLSIRRHKIPHLRAVVGNPKAVDPRLPDSLTRCVVIGVTLEILDEKEVARSENPERPFGHVALAIDLVDAPVVRCVRVQQAGIVTLIPKGLGAFVFGRAGIGVAHGLCICAHVKLVRSGGIRRRPAQCRIHGHVRRCIRRLWTSNSARRRKAPDVAFVRSGPVEFVNSPIVDLFFFERAGLVACSTQRCSSGGVAHLVKIIAKIERV